ncbi:transcription initiation factor TFIIIB [Bacillus kexueae]|uniref:transcription initiation factor TFIIIB n=1 Tax=Aeribacillus kexueae TaxID=2078952 RepID=UPI001FAFD167|nr:transcription initiation factor TFIIIB [Bacillus kexueae]
MKNTPIGKECPKCGSTDLGKGKLSGYSTMTPVNKVISLGSDIEYIICTDCGFIIEGYVTKPEKFKNTWG